MSDPNQFQAPPPPPTQAEPERRRPANLMWIGIGLVVLGIIVAVLGIIINLAFAWTGAGLCALGILFFGFSFMRLPEIPGAEPRMSTVSTLTGIFFEPTSVFRNLRAHPQWVAAILIAGALNAAYITAFYQRLTPDRIVGFTYDKLADSPIKPPPDQMEVARQRDLDREKSAAGKIGKAVGTIVREFFGVAVVAALCLLGVLAFGGRMHYWQTYAVVAYISFPVTVIQKLISFLVLYLRSPEDIHPLIGQETLAYDNLGLLVSSAEHPVIYVILATIGVLTIYRLWLTGTGLREGGYKVSSSAAWGTTITLFILGLLFRMAAAAIFPSFLG